MLLLALKMLVGDKLKYLGLLAGMAFSAMMIAQQGSIFVGLANQTTTFVRDRAYVDLWVMDDQIKFSEDRHPLRDTVLQLTRGVEGVEWAAPIFRDWLKMRLPDGTKTQAMIVGLDDATLLGAPSNMDQGVLLALRQDRAVLMEKRDGPTKLRQTRNHDTPTRVGDRISLNDHDAFIAGEFLGNPSFFWDPMLYTTYSRGVQFAPPERNLMSFVMVRLKAGVDKVVAARRIEQATGQKVMTGEAFAAMTKQYILTSTGILINFGLAVGLGFIVGLISTGQTFFNFTLDNLRYFASLKAMGASAWTLLGMVLTQVFLVIFLSFGLGVGLALVMGVGIRKSNLAFETPWYVLVLTLVSLLGIGALTGILSIVKVLRLEPGIVFK